MPSGRAAALACGAWALGALAIGLSAPAEIATPALWIAVAAGPVFAVWLARPAMDPRAGQGRDLSRRVAALEAAMPGARAAGESAEVAAGHAAAGIAEPRSAGRAARAEPERRDPEAQGRRRAPSTPRVAGAARRSGADPAVASPVRVAPAAAAPAPASDAAAASQPALALADDTPAASWPDLVRALDFPRDEADAEGMAALRSALRDPLAARLLQAAEDVLSILAANGLHMEDLRPDPPDPAAWLAYAAGARGAEIDAVGGVREAVAVEAARALTRADPVFRDAALVFASRWAQLAPRAATAYPDGAALAALADTRSGRAFMLLARAMGAFDAGSSREALGGGEAR